MKKCIIVLFFVLLLTGCSAAQTYETLGDVEHVSATLPDPQQIMLQLPTDASVLTSAANEGTMYLCGDYTILLQTLQSGNLPATVQTLSGFTPERLTMLQSRCGNHDRYDWVWTAAGEAGDTLCRAAVLDDGVYHYALTVMASAEDAGSLTDDWNELFSSFCLTQ